MAHTHNDVAAAFAHGKKVRHGSNMYNTINSRPLYWPSGDHQLFTVTGEGYSYRTRICQIVVNHHTGLSELWITPLTYSSSTSRHEDLYRHAFIKRYIDNHKVDYPTAALQVFTTPAVDDGTTRCHPHHAAKVYKAILADRLKEVDKPRLRSATRMGTLASIRQSLDNITRRMTADVPENAIDKPMHDDLMAMSAFIDNTMSLYRNDMASETIDEVRVAVRGFLALNRD